MVKVGVLCTLWDGDGMREPCSRCCNTTVTSNYLSAFTMQDYCQYMQYKVPTSAVKGIFSRWTPGKRSGSLLMQSFSVTPGGRTSAFSNSREKRWSTRALLNLSENALQGRVWTTVTSVANYLLFTALGQYTPQELLFI